MSEYGRQILDLMRQIEESEGFRIRNRIDALEFTIQIFKTNHYRLSSLLRRFREDGEFTMKAWLNRRDFFIEVHILHHNFLAAVKTLVDHSRIFVDEMYGGTEFREDYQRRVDEDFGAPLPQFVQRLRNYVLHYRLPMAAMTISGNKPGELLLEVDQLREWEGWTPRAREYLDTLDAHEPFEAHANAYMGIAEGFYMWFESRIREIHRTELDEYRSLSKRIEELRELDRQRIAARQAELGDIEEGS